MTNCIISGNFSDNSASYASSIGGAICISTDYPCIIANCIISGNSADDGSAIYNYNASPLTITNSLISGNTGGNVIVNNTIDNSCSATITNCTIAGNGAGENNNGNCIYATYSVSSIIRNSIIYGNDGVELLSSNGATFSVQNSIVDDGSYITNGVNGNSTANPLFTNAAVGDYSLKCGSPAINAGSNVAYIGNINTDTDLAGNPRLAGSAIDMGAYEFQPISTTITISGSGMTATVAQATGATYQWIDCATGQAVAGATNQSFTATTAGSYKVAVTTACASDTSACVNLAPTGIAKPEWARGINVYPNPFTQSFQLEINNADKNTVYTASITDVIGRQLLTLKGNVNELNRQLATQTITFDQGNYWLQLTDNKGNQQTLPIVKIK
jgi:hypothetical protein